MTLDISSSFFINSESPFMLVQPKRGFLQAGLVAYEKEASKYISRFLVTSEPIFS